MPQREDFAPKKIYFCHTGKMLLLREDTFAPAGRIIFLRLDPTKGQFALGRARAHEGWVIIDNCDRFILQIQITQS